MLRHYQISDAAVHSASPIGCASTHVVSIPEAAICLFGYLYGFYKDIVLKIL
jgi:hypothetical protein